MGSNLDMTGKLKYYMRHIDVESETLSTRPRAQSQTLSPARPADFGPFFVEFGVSLRSLAHMVYEKICAPAS